MRTPHAIVTGASGFVGGALAEGFLALGWRVTGIDRSFDASARARLAAAALVDADLALGAPTGLPDAQLVVHAAAVTTDPAGLGWTRATHIAANTRPLLSMLEQAALTPPGAFVFISSSGVFAPEDGAAFLTDADTPTGRSAYATAKRAGEQMTLAALEGVAAAHVVRLGYVFGPFESARPSRTHVSLVAEWLAAAREGRPLHVRADDPVRDWTFVSDLAPALARLIEGPGPARPVHLCSGHVVSDRTLAGLVSRHVPCSLAIETVSAAGPLKPPMAPSAIPALDGFAWTSPAAGLAALAASGAAA